MTSPDFVFRGADFFTAGPVACLIPSYMTLMLPVVAAYSMPVLSWVQYSLAHFLAILWLSALAPLLTGGGSGGGRVPPP